MMTKKRGGGGELTKITARNEIKNHGATRSIATEEGDVIWNDDISGGGIEKKYDRRFIKCCEGLTKEGCVREMFTTRL